MTQWNMSKRPIKTATQRAHLDANGVLWINGARATDPAPDSVEGDGHLFRFTMESKGRYRVTGHDGYFDEEEFPGEPWTIEVRAWSLDAALEKVRALGMNAWTVPGEEES